MLPRVAPLPGALALAALFALVTAQMVTAQVSKPIAHDHAVTKGEDGEDAVNKFLERKASPDSFDDEEALHPQDECPANLELRWMTEVTSSIYSTPVITDLFSDGHKEVLVPSFVHYLEVLEGEDGAKAGGDWPAFHKSTVHASPLVHDTGDGTEILLPMYDGEVHFYNDQGTVLDKKLYVPRLRVRKGWYVGLAPDHVDHSKPNVGAEYEENFESGFLPPDIPQSAPPPDAMAGLAAQEARNDGDGNGGAGAADTPGARRRLAQRLRSRSLLQEAEAGAVTADAGEVQGARAFQGDAVMDGPGVERGDQELTEEAAASFKVFDDEDGYGDPDDETGNMEDVGEERVVAEGLGGKDEEDGGSQRAASAEDDADAGADADVAGAGAVGGDSPEGVERVPKPRGGGFRDYAAPEEDYRAFWDGTDGDDEGGSRFSDESGRGPGGYVGGKDDHRGDDGHDDEGVPSADDEDVGSDVPPPSHPSPSLSPHHVIHAGWEDEDFQQRAREEVEEEYVYVDAHLLCTPAAADIDNDGRVELVLSVSYFYDREYYDNPAHAGELVDGIDIGKYVAGGIYVVDLKTLAVKWHTHLDLSTDSVSFRAYIYSTPTLVDLDRDGQMEIVVGTSVGFLYVLRSDGSTEKGWPIQMGEIQGQVAAADLDGDGYVELIAADTRGSVAAFKRDGTELWERHLASLVAQGVTCGDVDGDGELEIVVGTSSGAVHVLKGASGLPVKPFPFYTQGRIMSPILLTRLHPNNPALTLVVVSFDGFMYVIDGAAGCRDVIDIGETSYSMPLVDDLTGNGKMDIVLATMNGNVYAFESLDTAYDPLNSWTSQVHSVNNLAVRGGWYGVQGTERGYHDVRGAHIDVPFEIVDTRKVSVGKGGKAHGPYAVTVTVTTPGFSRTVNQSFDEPGSYALKADIPNWRARGRVTVRVSDQSKLFAEDTYSVSFHMRFYRVLKWILVVPFMLMTTALVQMTQEGNALPTFATQFRGGLDGMGAVGVMAGGGRHLGKLA